MTEVLTLLTDRGELSATDVVPIALAIRFPGTEIGSGDIDRVFMTAGSSGDPQFFYANPRIYLTDAVSSFNTRCLQY